jgi:hypothetical protein
MTIDYLRMLTDPLLSYWRFDTDMKGFKRFILLQKHYPLPFYGHSIEIPDANNSLSIALDIIYEFILSRQTIINIGFYAYNYYLKESKIFAGKKQDSKNMKYIPVPYYEMISTNYRTDFLDLMTKLETNELVKSSNLQHIEFYPFFQFTDSSVEIRLGDDIIALIYNNNKKCYPYLDVPAVKFNKKSLEEHKKHTIKIGTFQVTLLHTLINAMRARVISDKDNMNMYFTMVSHLVTMRNYYFHTTKKNILDTTPFMDFVINCIGETITPEKQRKLMIEYKKKKNKRLTFTYEPASGVKDPDSTYIFANTSGNQINNPKNMKLGVEYVDEYNVEDEPDDGKAENSVDDAANGDNQDDPDDDVKDPK